MFDSLKFVLATTAGLMMALFAVALGAAIAAGLAILAAIAAVVFFTRRAAFVSDHPEAAVITTDYSEVTTHTSR